MDIISEKARFKKPVLPEKPAGFYYSNLGFFKPCV